MTLRVSTLKRPEGKRMATIASGSGRKHFYHNSSRFLNLTGAFLKDMPNLSPELLHLVSIFAFTANNVSEKFLRYLPFVLEKQSLGLTYLAFLYISWKPVHA